MPVETTQEEPEDTLVSITRPDINLDDAQSLHFTIEAFLAQMEESFRKQFEMAEEDEFKQYWTLDIDVSVARDDERYISLRSLTYMNTG